MAYSTFTQSFGASFANAPVTIRNAATGRPAVILASVTGGVLSESGKASLDGSGALSVVIDTAQTWVIDVVDITAPTVDPVYSKSDPGVGTSLVDQKGHTLTLVPGNSIATVTAAQVAAGTLTGVVAVSDSGSLINPDGSAITGGGGGVTIVNNLTTGGSAAALSAQQGVVLKATADGLTTSVAAKADSAATTAALALKADASTTTTALAGKLATSSVVNDLVTGGPAVPLSAQQGVTLKGITDGLTTSVAAKADSAATTAALATKVQVAGDLSGTVASPTIAKIQGVAISGTPSAGQVIQATSPTAATWQTLAGGGGSTTLAALTDITTYDIGTNNTSVAAIKTTANSASTAAATAQTTANARVQLAGDLGGTVAAPTVAKIQGVVISGTPTNGQVLQATSGTAASWQTSAGGGSTTLAALTDIATYDIGTNNTSVAAIKTTANSASAAVALRVQLAGDLGGTVAAPTVTKIQGVVVSGTPTSGQVLQATSASAATWQTPSGGGGGGATIASGTLSTSSLTSGMDNSTQTAGASAVLTMPAGLACPSGIVIDAPSGATLSWGATYSVNGLATTAGSYSVGAGSYFILRQMQGTDTWSITSGTQNGLIAPRSDGSAVTLIPSDSGGISIVASACTVTVNSGLGLGFQRAFQGAGAVTFTQGSGVTVNDRRVTGATYPVCALVNTSLNTYDVIGGKA